MSYSYLCTYELYGPVRNAFDAGSIHYEGKQVGGGWAMEIETFWALSNGIEPLTSPLLKWLQLHPTLPAC